MWEEERTLWYYLYDEAVGLRKGSMSIEMCKYVMSSSASSYDVL